MIFTLNLRTLRPLRLCGRYSEFRLRLCRTGSFVVNIFFLTWLRLLQSYTTFLLLFDSPLHSVRSLGNRWRAPCRVPRFARTQVSSPPVFIVFSRARAHRRISCRKKLQEFSHVVDFLDPS